MKKSVSLLLSLLMIISIITSVPLTVSAANSGTCGENLSWTLDDNGTLTITGSGAMDDFGFQECPWYGSSVEDVVINEGVTSIGERAFGDCENIETVKIPKSVKSIGFKSFDFCTKLKHIVLPNGVEIIDDYAFNGCTNLESVILPDSLTSIGNATFYYCTNLTSISLSRGITSIGYYAFAYCEKLTSITIPDGVSKISELAFYYCIGLTSIEIPDSVTYIGDYAFINCKNLMSIMVPESVKTIGVRAMGYVYGEDDEEKLDGFTIYGKKGTAAETYANENGFTFIEIMKPAQPTLEKVSNIDSNVKIIWGEVEGADLYRVYRKIGTGDYEYIGSSTGTSYSDKKAPAGKTCRYYVKAKNEAGYSKASDSLAIKHIDEPTLKSIENSEYGVLIKWDKVTGAEKYNVYRKVSGGEYKCVGATSKTYYTDKTAKSGTKYYYAIRAKRDDSISSQSASLSKIYLADPTLKTPSSTKSGVKLTWSKVTGAEGYIIYRKTGSGSYTKIKTEKGVSNLSYTDSSAKKGKKYTYKVKAYKSKTYSAYSNTKSITDKY